MPDPNFIHLRVHSAYSLSEGAIKPEKIAALARELAMPAVAITDTSNLFGALEFSQYCTAAGVQPIIGCQLGLARNGQNLAPDNIVLLAQTPSASPTCKNSPPSAIWNPAPPAVRKSRCKISPATPKAISCSLAAPAAPFSASSPKAKWPRPKPTSPLWPKISPTASPSNSSAMATRRNAPSSPA
jgi:hypothetical protein